MILSVSKVGLRVRALWQAMLPLQPQVFLAAIAMFWKWILTVFVGILALFLTIYPRVTVVDGAPINTDNALTSQFFVTNNSILPLHNLAVGIGLCRIIVSMANGGTVNIAAENKEDACRTYDRVSLTAAAWRRKRFRVDERFAVSPADMLPGVDRDRVFYADIGIQVSYRWWFIPWRFSRIFRFQTRIGPDDKPHWYPVPLQ